ncbi:hypothetical protein R1flu_003161 [Riccia fluitans]|uniref:Secreted protein n=1 Tax=Riccia fluitans TaxID=41844 RepID=A0ABD1Y874_9MARC
MLVRTRDRLNWFGVIRVNFSALLLVPLVLVRDPPWVGGMVVIISVISALRIPGPHWHSTLARGLNGRHVCLLECIDGIVAERVASSSSLSIASPSFVCAGHVGDPLPHSLVSAMSSSV